MDQKNIKNNIEFILGEMSKDLKLLREEVGVLSREVENNKKLTWNLSKKIVAIWTAGTVILNYIIANPGIVLKFFKS